MPGATTQTRDREATSRRILAAASCLFAEHGYDQVTVRMIASAAGANVALINRYFGSKARLFAEVLVGASALESVIEGDLEGLPRRLARHMASRLDAAACDDPLVRVIDRAGASPQIRAVLRERVQSALTGPLGEMLPGPMARERAMLATSIILGGGSLRRVLGPDSLRDTDPGYLEFRLTAIFTACLAP
ncbi:TetR/AcrR family transcriptional regulator [Sphaerisporangium aureirubrum]|uniref:TetR/AcrR family transcriptional regulator n=1 Tax=Sphaerisporangium aureirubrum TaxID=1544736 RepID=A0ABW1NWN1_9ACTN